ncbi:unnamed protein product [Fraxinus pennsylvanica]|uniref:MATH domain-containing protein n=1 Tax=Fraxinus pennsylvanica TaxID=56036 RepID=A0AAD1ZWK9_9LAMI|nr:unnamed protein product [Fraxinus pennsylvanica]
MGTAGVGVRIGRHAEDGANHVSAYLAVENKSKPDAGWELNAVVSIFLLNHKLDKYVFKKGQRRFHLLNPEWGFSKFIVTETLTNPKLENEWNSEEFNAGDHKWKVNVYPKGQEAQKGSHVSIFLDKQEFSSGEKVKVDYSICMKNQYGNGDRKRRCAMKNWFSASDNCWGWSSFIPIADMKEPGFLVGDQCIIEVKISIRAVLRSLP